MVSAIGYTGIAMFEFRVNRANGAWVLLEVNARPWGSLPLPVALGVDFPYRWYRLLVDGEEIPSRAYRVGVYGRNFLPDIEQTVSRMRQLRNRPLELLKVGSMALAEFGRALIGREKSDVLVLDDLTPGLFELMAFVANGSHRVLSMVPGAPARRREHDRGALRRAIRRRKRGGVTINVVCQGNICRSPYAAAVLRTFLQPEFHRVRVLSAGMLPRMAVPSPAEAVEAASLSGVDLREHRSQHLSREAAESATVLVVFDEINRERLLNRYPAVSAPLVMMGSFINRRKWPLHIADPDGVI
jgi:protein-tyrosine-phosphatase